MLRCVLKARSCPFALPMKPFGGICVFFVTLSQGRKAPVALSPLLHLHRRQEIFCAVSAAQDKTLLIPEGKVVSGARTFVWKVS